ncbi:MAG: hypothetical protein DMG06_00835 [Acidobacteria bacterium]|nr:MAG: hypothetical protein DMG06_00835 [Acidobacteriota bacterium]
MAIISNPLLVLPDKINEFRSSGQTVDSSILDGLNRVRIIEKMSSDVTNQNKKEIKGYVLRRSPRAMVKISVFIKGKDKHGCEFEEESETLLVSKYGARIFTVHELEVEAVLKLRLKISEEWSEFRVVWIGTRENDTTGQVGIEFIHTTNFFGVSFPQEDWA